MVKEQLHLGSSILVRTFGRTDYLSDLPNWAEFSQAPTCKNIHINFDSLQCNYYNDIIAQLPLLQQPVQLTEVPTISVHWELGDHADNDIANASLVRRKAIPIEQHYDDCGDDTTPLDIPENEQTLFAEMFSNCSSDESATAEEGMFDSMFYLWHCDGSSVEATEVPPQAQSFDNFSDTWAFLQTKVMNGKHDYVEVFGGAGGVAKIAIRRQLTGGHNFDINSGFDLTQPKQVAALFAYLRTHKPEVVVMGPPCTSMGPWSHYNKVHHYETWHAAWLIGRPLAKLAAQIAYIQLSGNRHFICENPWNSQIWLLPEWVELLNNPRICCVYCDQCTLGLVDPTGEPTRKPTAFVASSRTLVYRLERECDGRHVHTMLAGNVLGYKRTQYAQVWPRRLCEAIVAGIQELLASRSKAFPVTELESCPACRQHAARDDTRHIRIGACRFPYDSPTTWTCPGCVKHQHNSNISHTRVPGECRWAEAATRASGSRTVRARNPRVPTVVIDEAPQDFEQPTNIPPPETSLGKWYPVQDLQLTADLDSIRQVDGWHRLEAGPASVTTNNRHVRTCQPRFDMAKYHNWSVYGYFPDHEHTHGNWWAVCEYQEYSVTVNLGYPIPISVVIYHEMDASSLKNKPENAAEPNPFADDNPFRRASAALDEPGDEAPTTPIAQRRAIPKEAVDDGTGAAEEPPEALPEAQQDVAVPVDWSSWDLGKALRALRSDNVAIINKTLRQLHIRWWHCSHGRMASLLKAAGLPKKVIDQVQTVTDTCRVCRLWTRPSARPQATLRLSEEFNQVIQVDLLFISTLIVLHVIDECTRWSAGAILASKLPSDILSGLVQVWFRIFGAPGLILADGEGALQSEDASIFYERWSTTFRAKPVGAHAQIVERHHELVRQTFHRIRSQALAEGLVITDSDILAETFYAKNAIITVHGKTPCTAVLGRTPNILREFDVPGVSVIDDATGGDSSKHAVRLRELAVQAMVEGTAKDRIQRASATQSRPSGQLHELQPGDQVDLFRSPKQKDNVGWRGPATVLSTHNLEHGFVEVQWGGRAMSVRIPDLRRALSYLTLIDEDNHSLNILRQHALTLSTGFAVYAFVLNEKGWVISKAAAEHPGVFRASLFTGYNTFGLRCIGARIGQAVAVLQGMSGVAMTVLFWYPSNNPMQYRTLQVEGSTTLQLRIIFGAEWIDVKWMQFLSCSKENAPKLKLLLPDEPFVGEDPTPDGQYPQPPRQDDIMADPMSDDDEEQDDLMPDLPQIPPPRFPPQPPQRPPRQPQVPPPAVPKAPPAPLPKAVSTGTTRRSRSAVNTQQSAEQEPWRVPVPTWASGELQPVPSNQSARSRTPYPSQVHPPGGKSKSASMAKQLMRPPGRPGSSQETAAMAPTKEPKTNQTKGTPSTQYGGSSASNAVAPTILLPTHDTDSDDVSVASTAETKLVHDYHFGCGKVPPPILTAEQGAILDQTYHTSNQPTLEGPWVTQTGFSSDDSPQWEFSPGMCKLCTELPQIKADEVLVIYLTAKGKSKMMIEKELDALTAADVKRDWLIVEVAIRKELKSFFDMKTFERILRKHARNICSSRWVFRYKIIDGQRTVKARLTIRGFQDLAEDLDTYAGTASRWGQRLIVSVAVQRGWPIWMADVSTAFLQGLTFVELAALTNTEPREVSFTPPVGAERFFQELPGMQDYDPLKEVLRMLKSVYGLRDAPKAWKIKLDRTLRAAGGRPLHTDHSCWVWFGAGNNLQMLLSTHVDDLKGAGEPDVVKKLLAILTREFGKLTMSYGSFEHCGISYASDKLGITLHQDNYCKQLMLMDAVKLAALPLTASLDALMHAQYLSLLGGVSWLIQTRLDIAVYTCALQRAAKHPKVEHALRLNKVVKFVKRKLSRLVYHKLASPCRIIGVSDSAFRKEDAKGLAMRGSVIAVGELSNLDPGGRLHILEFYARKQRRVTRSTFSAELNALSDTYEFAKLIAMTVCECISPHPYATTLTHMEENGSFSIPVECVVDARSVFDALKADDIRPPSEPSLVMFLCQLKEALLAHGLKRLWWVDTRDMVADGLNKGSVSRVALLRLCNTGIWKLEHAAIGWSESRHIPIQSVQEMLIDEGS